MLKRRYFKSLVLQDLFDYLRGTVGNLRRTKCPYEGRRGLARIHCFDVCCHEGVVVPDLSVESLSQESVVHPVWEVILSDVCATTIDNPIILWELWTGTQSEASPSPPFTRHFPKSTPFLSPVAVDSVTGGGRLVGLSRIVLYFHSVTGTVIPRTQCWLPDYWGHNLLMTFFKLRKVYPKLTYRFEYTISSYHFLPNLPISLVLSGVSPNCLNTFR